MSRIKKSQFKKIVKECLIEILSEGIGTKSNSLNTDMNMSQLSSHTRSSAPDNISFSNAPDKPNVNFEKNIKESVSLITSDPLMQSIFADTAKTTLQSQLHEDPGSMRAGLSAGQGDAASHAMAKSDPMDIFENSGNWAALAFSDSDKK